MFFRYGARCDVVSSDPGAPGTVSPLPQGWGRSGRRGRRQTRFRTVFGSLRFLPPSFIHSLGPYSELSAATQQQTTSARSASGRFLWQRWISAVFFGEIGCRTAPFLLLLSILTHSCLPRFLFFGMVFAVPNNPRVVSCFSFVLAHFFLVLPDRFDRKDARPASSRTRRVPGPPPPSWPFRTTPAAANRSASWGWPPSDRP